MARRDEVNGSKDDQLALLNVGVQISGILVKLAGHKEGTEKNLTTLYSSFGK